MSTLIALKIEINHTIIVACVTAASREKVDDECNLASDEENYMLR